jgi:hypothetical protein
VFKSEKLDDKVKEVISLELDNIGVSNDMYKRIEESIENKRKNFIFRYGFGIKKSVLAFSLSLTVLISVSLLLSPTARAIAEDTMDAIKTIFVVEGTGDNYKVVEKDGSNTLFTYGVSASTTLSDTDLSKLLGYTVKFPQSINNEYTLVDKALSLNLEKQLDYFTSQNLTKTINQAITDPAEFKKLKKYGPKFSVTSIYKSLNNKLIYVHIDKSNPIFSSGYTKIGDSYGYWDEISIPDYPGKTIEGVYSADMTQKPTGVKKCYSLSWDANSLHYILSSYEDNNVLTSDEAANLAEAFMKSQR